MCKSSSELVLAPSMLYSKKKENIAFQSTLLWSGVPLNFYRSQEKAERGPCHNEAPAVILSVNAHGRRWYRQNGKTVAFVHSAPGQMDLLGHDYQREWGRWDYTPGYTIGMQFPALIIERLAPELSTLDLRTEFQVVDPKVQWLVHELALEARQVTNNGAVYIEGLSCALIARLEAVYGVRKAITSHTGCLSAKARQTVIDYIESCLGENLSLAVLAGSVGLSPHHFARCFVKSFGCPPHRYIQKRRVEVAWRMLSVPNCSLSLTDVATNLGFSSPSHFSNVFKQQTGVSPSYVRSGSP